MLKDYCNSLSDDAQIRIALRLGNLAIPIWENYFIENPDEINTLNGLINDSNRIAGGLAVIDIAFPKRALEKIERSYIAAKAKSPYRPLPVMKGDPTLSPLLATCMQPLTNKKWDRILTNPVRLVFTLVFNILMWILYRRNTIYQETHIYVAINQGTDALFNASLLNDKTFNSLLDEYAQEKRQESELCDWENALPVGRSEPQTEEDILRRIIGEKIYKGQCGPVVAKEVLRQMREEGKSYWNGLEDPVSSYSKT